MADGDVENVGRELWRRWHRRPHLAPGERITLDFGALPCPGDLLLVHTGRVFAVERARSKGRRRPWIVAVIRTV